MVATTTSRSTTATTTTSIPRSTAPTTTNIVLSHQYNSVVRAETALVRAETTEGSTHRPSTLLLLPWSQGEPASLGIDTRRHLLQLLFTLGMVTRGNCQPWN